MQSELSRQSLEELVAQAKEGDKNALEIIISRIQNQIYHLAVQMLWHPADAEDACQEILIKVITHLGQFRQESSFTTWVYRIASNHLLTTRKRRAELYQLTFEQLGLELENRLDRTVSLTAPQQVDPEQRLLLQEVQLRCTLGMLLCLDREQRLAYILTEIIGLTGEEGANVMEITPVAFRKRLSRARHQLRNFMQSNCGLVNPANPCRCERQLPYKVQHEKLSKERLLFAGQPYTEKEIQAKISELKEIDRTAALYRSQPQFASPERLTQALKVLLASGRFSWFH
jgi:RNA polymerase sigma factor (sigma-70 family)